MAPTFVAKPTIRQDADGTTLIFHCSIMADPRPAISWFRNGVKVQDNEKFQVGSTSCTNETSKLSFPVGVYLIIFPYCCSVTPKESPYVLIFQCMYVFSLLSEI